MKRPAILLLAALPALSQICVRDPQGNQICASTQADTHICGYGSRFPGGGRLATLFCDDVVVRKTSPSGVTVYSRVLAGNSEDLPHSIYLDSAGNTVLLGTTYSSDFPVTANASQPTYAGPAPVALSNGNKLSNGGDLFLSVLSPGGELIYSTYLGTSADDRILDLHRGPDAQLDILTGAAAPMLLNLDFDRHAKLAWVALPVDAGHGFEASWLAGDTAHVVTDRTLQAYDRMGRPLSSFSLESYGFLYTPTVKPGPDGDLWLYQSASGGGAIVTRLIGGTMEAFRWTLPASGYFLSFYLGADGAAYLGGQVNAYYHDPVLPVTSNAFLVVPCSAFTYFLAVLNPQGAVKLLSYLDTYPESFEAAPDGSVAAFSSRGPNPRTVIDFAERPKIGCFLDALRDHGFPGQRYSAGQPVRLRGNGFGPAAHVALVPGANQRYPTGLNSLEVLVEGAPAPILSAGPGEVTFLLPLNPADTTRLGIAVRDAGLTSAAYRIDFQALDPQVLYPAVNQDGTLNDSQQPAAWGSVISVFLTGAAFYSPTLVDGQIAALGTLDLPIDISFNSQPATVLYAGPAPGLPAGITQINLRLPPVKSSGFDGVSAGFVIGGRPVSMPVIYVK